MKQSTRKLISMLASLFFVIAAFVFYFNFVSPAYGGMQALKGKELSEQNFFAQESNTISQVQKSIAAYQNESQTQNAVSLSLPSKQDISGALTQIYGIAAVNNINIQNMSISVSSVVSNSAGSGATATVLSPLIKPVGSISFVLTAVGSYGDFKNFLSEIETNARIFDIKNLSVQPMLQGGSGVNSVFSYNLTVAAYYQTQ